METHSGTRNLLAAAWFAPILIGLGMFGSLSVQADEALSLAVAGSQRSTANAARDSARHPYETLSFFGIRPNHTVVELTPGGGWYSEILAPYLRDTGKLILAADDPASTIEYRRRAARGLRQKLAAQPSVFDRVELRVFEPPTKLRFAASGTVDMVLTFRNVHNWVAISDASTRAVFANVYDSLKTGGIFGVVDHRLPENRAQDPKARSGYLHSSYVVQMAQGVGFKLVARSEINANPRDTSDHPNGVWALPPSASAGALGHEAFAAIGESDRFTLKFVKP